MSAVGHGTHGCRVTQQTCLLCDTEDMAAVWLGGHVCCVTQQICLLIHAADMSAVKHSRLCVSVLMHAREDEESSM